MGKPPTTDQELSARVEALEDRADATDAAMASLDARVTTLEALVTTGEPPPAGAHPDHELPRPPVRPDHTLPTPEPKPPKPPTTGSRLVVIVLDGYEHPFREEDGTDLGDYVGPHFTQHCIAVRCDTLPDFTVMFRPDADGSREEVVFEFGRCHGNPAGSVLNAYTATIFLGDDGDEAVVVSVPKHYYYSRWRWQSAPRPVTASVADLVAAKLVPYLDKTLVPGMRAGVHADDGPMQPNGITTYMSQTGERDDIGVLTESQADYLMYEDAHGLGTVRAWLEGSAAFPWHHRDEKTGAPLDVVTAYPGAGTYNGSQPQIPLYYTYEEDLWPDTSHAPDLAYVPFLLTGDPYALEELQFQATFDYVAQPTKGYCIPNSLRSYAWHMRNVAHCVVATPDVVPSWLQPKEHWQTYLDGALAYSLDMGPNKAADTHQQLFRDISELGPGNAAQPGGLIPCLMESYTMAVYQHMTDLGLTGWNAMRDWKLPGVIARTNGTSGYNRSIPDAYVRADAPDVGAAPFADWAALWAYNETTDPTYYGGADPTQEHLATNNPNINYGYISYMLACLNLAVRQGVTDAEPCAAWLGAEMAGKWPYMRWAVG